MPQINVTVNGRIIVTDEGTTLLELSKVFPGLTRYPIIVAKVNNELQDLTRPIAFDCNVDFLDVTDPNGFRTYQRTATFMMIHAAKTVLGRNARVVVEHSINKNYYCELPGPKTPISDGLLQEIEALMRETSEKNAQIEKLTLPLDTALHIADELRLEDKVSMLKYRRSSTVNFYKLDWFYDYFYGQMAPSTGYVTHFKLTKSSGGFMLQFPTVKDTYELSEYKPILKVSEVFEESNRWARILKVDTVGSLNDRLCQSGGSGLIRVAEALHEKKIAMLADRIMQENRSIVLIAGPSSSGKTTFSNRLGIQLRVNGIKASVISLDNYYINRDMLPKDENGNYDFETIDALDTGRIDADLQALTQGETVEVPVFNFITGKREPKGKLLKLESNDVLIMEGIHGLNERIGGGVAAKDKFKIFISALTQLNIDDHNRIPTTDTRLVRRIVRDFRFRGFDALRTIDLWPSVLRGESKYIFPYQEDADAFFNSALIYEMCVLKQYAEPLLFGVAQDQPAYAEAKRLVKFLDSFLGVSSEDVPQNSILREFVGGSCF